MSLLFIPKFISQSCLNGLGSSRNSAILFNNTIEITVDCTNFADFRKISTPKRSRK